MVIVTIHSLDQDGHAVDQELPAPRFHPSEAELAALDLYDLAGGILQDKEQ